MAVIGLPRLGIYSNSIKKFFEGLGYKVLMPSRITQEIIKLGVMNSADFMCFPYKVVLGQHIWSLEQGATDLIMWNNCGLCRMKHYHELEMATLKDLGYNFSMHTITKKTIRKSLRQLGNLSLLESLRRLKKIYAQFKVIEEKSCRFASNKPLNIGLIGEVYTIWEQDINFDIVRKLQKLGVNVHISITLTDFINRSIIREREIEREARKLISQELGGHGFESLCNTIWYAKNGFDGVIHLTPLSCMPESTIEILVDQMAQKYGIPLYRFPIDESNFETGFNTRLETFISMLKRRKDYAKRKLV